jgi:hypothetical protein
MSRLLARTAGAPGDVGTGVGEIGTMRMLDPSASRCSDEVYYATFPVRTVYSGTHAIVVEDTANQLARRMDDRLQHLGRDLDDVLFEVITANFGDPLALDPELDANGKVVVLVSQRVNAHDGLAGFVLSCDFLPREGFPGDSERFPASNQGEVVYAFAPTGYSAPAGGLGLDLWDRIIRSVVVHELKHVASLAERFARGAGVFEEVWLEEGTAVHAEELWARTIFGNAWKGNASYSGTLYCELNPTASPPCRGKPLAMFAQFAGLYEYADRIESLSPLLVDPHEDPAATFYSSAWWLVRWAIDHYAPARRGRSCPRSRRRRHSREWRISKPAPGGAGRRCSPTGPSPR